MVTREYIEFEHWSTEEKIKRELSFSNPSEEETELICPFDNTHILFSYDHMSKGYFCPNCETNYNIPFKDQEEVNKAFELNIKDIQDQIKEIDKKRGDLGERLYYAHKKGLLNKDNLSERKKSKLSKDTWKFLKEVKEKVNKNPLPGP